MCSSDLLAALDQLVNKHGVQLHQWPDDIVAKMQGILPRVMAEHAAKSEMATEISANWTAFRDQQRAWGNVTDYINAVLKKG